MKIGFIGAGNMACAMIGGIIEAGIVTKDEIIASSATQKTADRVASQLGIKTTLDNVEVAQSDIVVLAIKPIFCEEVIHQIAAVVTEKQLIISIVAGRSLTWMNQCFGKNLAMVRTMPNTPALVGEGMTALCLNDMVSDIQKQQTVQLFESFGEAEIVPERLMDAVVAVSGSSPAYVFLFMEAMADAAVAEGMPRQQAYHFVAQSVLGSAKMLLDTGKHPGELKDMVCSPAGTTIAAVCKLEEKGFRSSVMECMKACADKSRNL